MADSTVEYHADDNSGVVRNYGNIILTGIVVLGVVVRLFRLDYESLWYDELYSAWVRQLPLSDLLPEILAANHPPVYYLITHYMSWAGSGEFAFRLFSALIGAATIPLVYLLCRELFSRRIGLWAAAFTAFSPFLIWYSRDATSYSWVIFICLLSLYLLVLSIRRSNWQYWTAYVLVTTVAFYSHYLTVTIFIGEIFVYWLLRDKKRKQLIPWVVSQSILLLTLASSLIIGRLTATNIGALSATNLGSGRLPGILSTISKLGGSAYSYLEGYARHSLGSGSIGLKLTLSRFLILLLVVILLAGAISFSRHIRRRLINKKTVAIAIYTLVLIAIPVLIWGSDKGIAGRYVAFAAPTYLILVALVVMALPGRVRNLAGIIVLGFLVFFSGWELHNQINDDWRSLMAIIKEKQQSDDHVLCFPLHNCYVAADVYNVTIGSMSGGFINPKDKDAVFLMPSNSEWTGYRNGYVQGETSFVKDLKLLEILKVDTDGSNRLWLVAGDGRLGNYPAASVVEKTLSEDWEVIDQWDISPLKLTLYQRKLE